MIVERTSPVSPSANVAPAVSDLELHLLLEAVARTSGHDFREYAPATLRRRITDRVRAENVATISGLQERILHAPGAIDRLIDAVTYNPSTPFVEPAFFTDFLERVLPRLRTFSHVRMWVAGCGGADDAYALAILCREAGFEHRVRIYATDVSDSALERARNGRFPAADLDAVNARYLESGGQRRIADYVTVSGAEASYNPTLRENIIFAQHNLAVDGSFNEFHLIVARHVLGHFSRTLAYRAHQVIYESLVRLGYLGLGTNESLRYTPHQRAYDDVPGSDRFHRRVR